MAVSGRTRICSDFIELNGASEFHSGFSSKKTTRSSKMFTSAAIAAVRREQGGLSSSDTRA